MRQQQLKYQNTQVSRNVEKVKEDLDAALRMKELRGESHLSSLLPTPLISPQNTRGRLLENTNDFQDQDENQNFNRSNASQKSIQENSFSQRARSTGRCNTQRIQRINDSVDQILIDIESECMKSKELERIQIQEQQRLEEDLLQRRDLIDSFQQNIELQTIQNQKTNENLSYENTLLKQEIEALNVKWNQDRQHLQLIESNLSQKEFELSKRYELLKEQINVLLAKEKKYTQIIESQSDQLGMKDDKIQQLRSKLQILEGQNQQLQNQFQEKNGFIQNQAQKINDLIQLKQLTEKLKSKTKQQKAKYKKEIEQLKDKLRKQKIINQGEIQNLQKQNEEKKNQVVKLEQEVGQKEKSLQQLDSTSYKQLKELLAELNSSHIKEAIDKIKDLKLSQQQTLNYHKFTCKFTDLYQQITGSSHKSLKTQ